MSITVLAAVARNGVIGADGELPWHLPGELKRLKAVTMGHVLVMGRLTYESIGRPLPGRTTIVVTRQPDWEPGGGLPEPVRVAGSVEDALALAAHIDGEVFVFGGGQVYAAALPVADRLQITWVEAEPKGDVYFPAVDWSQWQEIDREQHDGWSLVRYDRA